MNEGHGANHDAVGSGRMPRQWNTHAMREVDLPWCGVDAAQDEGA